MTEKRKAIFLDKDGTLIPDIPYNVNPDLITLQNGIIEGLKLLQQEGYCFVVISNQAGVARGYFEYDALENVRNKIESLLNEEGIKIESYYFCPHHPDGKVEKYTGSCECRKPQPGMILEAAQDLEIDTQQSWMIGDILNDAEAGNRAGCRTILINNGNETEWLIGSHRNPTFVTTNFLKAALFIKDNPFESLKLKDWQNCKNILIIRADNMGDLIMSGPAIRALKETFSAKITVLTSSMAVGVAPFLQEIDEVIVFDLPWVKTKEVIGSDQIFNLVEQLKQKKFDAAVIFTVFSQNPLPAAMITYIAGIPLRLAYGRENPYKLLTHWIPDKEPYSFIQHQVKRDLALVNSIGAHITDNNLHLNIEKYTFNSIENKLTDIGIDVSQPWLIFHAGVSEKKREYPAELWVEAALKFITQKGFQILFTGNDPEKILCEKLAMETGENAFSVAGLLKLDEFIALVKEAPVVVSVNTGTVHIAAAVNTPVVVLYAQTNPQHTPWMVPNKVLEFGVEEISRSKNEVIQYLYKEYYTAPASMPQADEIYSAVTDLLANTSLQKEEEVLHLDIIK